MAFLTQNQLDQMGFLELGDNVLISDKASIYNAKNISIGDHSRIDDFAILSAGDKGIRLGRYVHIGCFASLIGKELIIMDDYSGVSGRVSIYSSSDNYDGEWMTNPTLPCWVLNTYHKQVIISKHSVIGAGSVILPGVRLFEHASVGAMSLVKQGDYKGGIWAGIPAKRIGDRKSNIVDRQCMVD